MKTMPTPNPSIRRRNSISTSVVVPTKLNLPTNTTHHPSFSFPTTTTTIATTSSSSSSSSSTSSFQSFPTLDFDILSIKPNCSSSSYTSLKDLLPSSSSSASVQSPTAQSQSHISIRNRLVKQAAWAYLQPMSSPDSSGRGFFHRFCVGFSVRDFFKDSFYALFSFLDGHMIRTITRFFDRMLRAVRVWRSR